MTRAALSLAALVLSISVAALNPAQAHDYAELSPLSPQLRTVLIEVLEAAQRTGRLTPPDGADVDAASEEFITRSIEGLDREERRWLADKVAQTAGFDDELRVPPNLLVPLFHELAEFMQLYREHAHGATDDVSAKTDFERLQALANDWSEGR